MYGKRNEENWINNEELAREYRKNVKFIFSFQYFLYGRGQSMNKIFNSHHFILNKNLKGMMVMVNIGAKEEGSC